MNPQSNHKRFRIDHRFKKTSGRRSTNVLKCLLIIFGLLSPSVAVQAENKIVFNGQVRARLEIDKKSFSPMAANKSFIDLRTRLAAFFLIEDNTHFFAQLQDSRRLGGQNSEGADQSGTLNNSSNVDVHQAYLEINELWQNGIGIQVGRFEVNLGNQRVFGSVGWHNVGRSWEGARMFLGRTQYDVSGYWLKGRELNDPLENRDFDIFGVNTRLKKYTSEFFVFWEHDADRFDLSEATNIDRLNRVSIGGYSKRIYDPIDFELNAVYQFGEQRAAVDTVFTEQSISAILITFEAGYTVNEDRQARFAAGLDYASGDEDPMDDTFEAYNNLYYTGHKFRGFMDYFIPSNSEGLIDLMLRGKMSPAKGWLMMADLHYFRTDADFFGVNLENSRNIGVEIDLGVSTKRIPGVTFTGGGAVFLPSEAFAGIENDPGLWFYTMFTAGF